MKKICKKLIMCLMIVLILFNFLATSGGNLGTVYARAGDTDSTNEAIAAANEGEESASGSINGIGSFIERAIRALVVIMGSLIQSLGYFVMSSGGTTTSTSIYLSPFDIFFDTFTLTNVNVFTTDDLPTTSSGDVDTTGIVYSLRSAISGLFYLVTGLAMAILFIFVILAFIRRFLESSPERKKDASNAMMDCLYSFILIIFSDVFIILILRINTTFINILRQFAENLDVSNFVKNLRSQALSDSYLLGWGCTIAFVIVCWQTFKFGIAYIMRFFMVSLLIIIAPVMGLFYSHSKSAKGMPGGFNKWFKLFLSNLFIQTVDALLYILCVAIPLSGTLSADVSNISGLAGAVMLIAGVMFVKQGEKVLMKLLGLEDSVISMNYVSNGISNAVNTVANTALTGVAIAQGNYSVMNVTNSPVSFGNDISGGTAGTAAGTAGITNGTNIHQVEGTLGGATSGGAFIDTVTDRDINSKKDSDNKDSDGDRTSIDQAIATTEQSDEANEDEELLDELQEQSNEEEEELDDELDESVEGLQGKLDESIDELSEDLQGQLDDLSEDSKETKDDGVVTETNETSETTGESSDMIHMVSEEVEITSDSKIQQTSEFIDRHEKYRDKFDDIDEMYKANNEKHADALGVAGEGLDQSQMSEISRFIDEKLRLGKEHKDGVDSTTLPVSQSSIDEVKKYIDKLGANTAEGKYAAAFLDFDIDKRNIDALNAQNMIAYQYNLDDAKNRGLITDKQAKDLKYGMAPEGSEERRVADQALAEIRTATATANTSNNIQTTTAVTGASAGIKTGQPSTTNETVFDRGTLREVYNRQDTRDTLNAIAAPLRTIKETNPKIIDGKVDISFSRVSEIVGRVEAKYDYEEELEKIKDKIKVEGEEAESAFAEFENARTIEEQTEAAKNFTTAAQAEGAKLIVEKQIGSVMVSSVVASQTATENIEVSQQNSSTRNVLDQLAQRGAQDATTKK